MSDTRYRRLIEMSDTRYRRLSVRQRLTVTPQSLYTYRVKRRAVDRKPGMRGRTRSQNEAELAAAIVARIRRRLRGESPQAWTTDPVIRGVN